MMQTPTQEYRRDLYCTKCTAVTPHSGEMVNGEPVFFCTAKTEKDFKGNIVPHHFVKFPSVKTAEELETLMAKHEEVNKPVAELKQRQEQQGIILNQVLSKGTKVTIESKPE